MEERKSNIYFVWHMMKMKYLLIPILILSTTAVHAQNKKLEIFNQALENLKLYRMEQTMTPPKDALDQALAEFNYGYYGSTESEELLQLPSSRD
jgi:hypothetical protein